MRIALGRWPMPIPCCLDRKEQRPRSSSTTRACNGTSRGVSRAACQDSDLGSPESWLRRGHTYARAGVFAAIQRSSCFSVSVRCTSASCSGRAGSDHRPERVHRCYGCVLRGHTRYVIRTIHASIVRSRAGHLLVISRTPPYVM